MKWCGVWASLPNNLGYRRKRGTNGTGLARSSQMLRLHWESLGAKALLSQLLYVFETYRYKKLIIKKGQAQPWA